MSRESCDVAIMGAGASGLAAAHHLSHSGLSVLILEARDRIGGRILTVSDRTVAAPVEMGAEFLHGQPQSILSLAQRLGLKIIEAAGTSWACTNSGPEKSEDVMRAWKNVAREMKRAETPDRSFDAFIKDSRHDERTRELARAYVEGFHAAHTGEVSVQSLVLENEASDQIKGDRIFRLDDGYKALVHWLAADSRVPIRLNTLVRSVQWQQGRVRINTPKAEALLAHGPEQLVSKALESLSALFKTPLSRAKRTLRGHFYHDWYHDPFARGAYSYTPVNSFDARSALTMPIDTTIFFAGEATNTEGAHGTVHGALDSGMRAATQVLEVLPNPMRHTSFSIAL